MQDVAVKQKWNSWLHQQPRAPGVYPCNFDKYRVSAWTGAVKSFSTQTEPSYDLTHRKCSRGHLRTMTPELSTTEQMIYTTYRANHGELAASRWLKRYVARRQQPSKQSLFGIPGASERPAELSEGPSACAYRHLPPPNPSEVISARHAVPEALSYDGIRTALYSTEARTKLIAEAEALAGTLRSCAVPVGARSDRRAAVEKLHTNLVTLALAVKQARGYAAAAQITVHQSAELLAGVLGMGDASLYRYLPLLREAGLIDYRGNKSNATVEGETCTRADGTLIAICLQAGSQAKLCIHDFGTYRDLDADRQAGRTAYRYKQKLRESLKNPQSLWLLRPLIIWALAPGHFHNLPLDVTLSLPSLALETLLDIPSVNFSDRCQAVEIAAGAVAANLADGQSHRFWCDVLWRLLRLHDQGRAEGSFGVVYNVVMRCVIDAREGFARKPGALAQSRLKQWAGWDEVRRVALCRVAPKPL